jgi:hypothetical protein
MNRTVIAIDPGKSGGIAYRIDNAQSVVSIPMPETEGDILETICAVQEGSTDPANAVAYIEQVGGFIKGRPAPGSAMFNFGRNFGYLIGVLQALKIRIELVRPQEWQKDFALGTSDGDKTAWKNKLKQRAQQLFPQQKVTLSTADALLILEYGKRRAL